MKTRQIGKIDIEVKREELLNIKDGVLTNISSKIKGAIGKESIEKVDKKNTAKKPLDRQIIENLLYIKEAISLIKDKIGNQKKFISLMQELEKEDKKLEKILKISKNKSTVDSYNIEKFFKHFINKEQQKQFLIRLETIAALIPKLKSKNEANKALVKIKEMFEATAATNIEPEKNVSMSPKKSGKRLKESQSTDENLSSNKKMKESEIFAQDQSLNQNQQVEIAEIDKNNTDHKYINDDSYNDKDSVIMQQNVKGEYEDEEVIKQVNGNNIIDSEIEEEFYSNSNSQNIREYQDQNQEQDSQNSSEIPGELPSRKNSSYIDNANENQDENARQIYDERSVQQINDKSTGQVSLEKPEIVDEINAIVTKHIDDIFNKAPINEQEDNQKQDEKNQQPQMQNAYESLQGSIQEPHQIGADLLDITDKLQYVAVPESQEQKLKTQTSSVEAQTQKEKAQTQQEIPITGSSKTHQSDTRESSDNKTQDSGNQIGSNNPSIVSTSSKTSTAQQGPEINKQIISENQQVSNEKQQTEQSISVEHYKESDPKQQAINEIKKLLSEAIDLLKNGARTQSKKDIVDKILIPALKAATTLKELENIKCMTARVASHGTNPFIPSVIARFYRIFFNKPTGALIATRAGLKVVEDKLLSAQDSNHDLDITKIDDVIRDRKPTKYKTYKQCISDLHVKEKNSKNEHEHDEHNNDFQL